MNKKSNGRLESSAVWALVLTACLTVFAAGALARDDTIPPQIYELLVQQEYTRALDELRKLADKGNTEAKFNVARLLELGWGTPPDQMGALKLYEEAGNAGNVPSQYYAGRILLRGAGSVARDYQRSRYWFEMAARNNHKGAAIYLARMYELGLGVEIDLEKAKFWMEFGVANPRIKSKVDPDSIPE